MNPEPAPAAWSELTWKELQSSISIAENTSVLSITVYLLIGGLLALYIRFLYRRCNSSLSDADSVARIFPALTMVTIGVIAVVKSSLALSLGLVGALSIVRFRAAIKEPEELAYLFLAIALGLGFGANQGIVTTIGFVLICAVVFARSVRDRKDPNQSSLFLTIASTEPAALTMGELESTIGRHCNLINLKRFDQEGATLEASYQVEFKQAAALQDLRAELLTLQPSMRVTFVDSEGIF